MESLLQGLRRLSGKTTVAQSATSPVQALYRYPLRVGGVRYQEGDRVIVISREGKRIKSRLTEPLSPEGATTTGQRGSKISHGDIIGKPAGRLYVHAPDSNKANKTDTVFRVQHPTLEQFVSLSPRTVTPIYSSYGATILTLLDIHLAPPQPSNDPERSQVPPFQILEAGTGNGGLTLHLAKAIAAANLPPPSLDNDCTETELAESWQQWRSKRRAIIHTVEFEESRSRAAEKLIKSFRGALYWPHIDFHSGDVGIWVNEQLQRQQGLDGDASSFLDIVILDLPSVHKQIENVVKAMNEDGQLLVWVPQITQVASCQQEIERLDLPLKLDQVVELGEGISNGRRWDLRFVRTRVQQRREREESNIEETHHPSMSDSADAADGEPEAVPSVTAEENPQSGVEFPTMVCRPIVGNLIMGGGFVGLWRKVPPKKSKAVDG